VYGLIGYQLKFNFENMKFLVSLVLISLVSFVTCIYLPWWSIALVAFFVIALIPLKPLYAFIAGFSAIFVLWIVIALITSNKNDNILAHKISMIILKADSPVLLILVTGLIGALVAGFAALAGSYLRKGTQSL
jgi:hypothetical protein